MGDCPGSGSGDPRDYDHRSLEEQKSARYRKAMNWIEKKGFKLVRKGTPEHGEYFVNYNASRDCFQFVPHGKYGEAERKILKAEYEQLYGTIKMIPLNLNSNWVYFVVEKKS